MMLFCILFVVAGILVIGFGPFLFFRDGQKSEELSHKEIGQ